MNNYDDLIDALDEYRESKDALKRYGYEDGHYDPVGDEKKMLEEKKRHSHMALDSVFRQIINEVR